jgi:transcriptional regulator with XRE-family HTH domain
MNVDYATIGQRIKHRRKALQKTQDCLAESLSVSVGYISQIERGVTKVSLDTLATIAKALDCDLPELLDGVIPDRPNYLEAELKEINDQMSERQKILLLNIAKLILQYGGLENSMLKFE